MLVTVSLKGKFNYQTIEFKEKIFNEGVRMGIIKHNVGLDRWEAEFSNEKVFHQILRRRGL